MSKEHVIDNDPSASRMQMLLPEHMPSLTAQWSRQCQLTQKKSLDDVLNNWFPKALDANDAPFALLMFREAKHCCLLADHDKYVYQPLLEMMKDKQRIRHTDALIWLPIAAEIGRGEKCLFPIITASLRHAHKGKGAFEQWLQNPDNMKVMSVWLSDAMLHSKSSVIKLLAQKLSPEMRQTVANHLLDDNAIPWMYMEPNSFLEQSNQGFPVLHGLADRIINVLSLKPPSTISPVALTEASPQLWARGNQKWGVQVDIDIFLFRHLLKKIDDSRMDALICATEANAAGCLVLMGRLLDALNPQQAQQIAQVGIQYIERSKILDWELVSLPRLRAIDCGAALTQELSEHIQHHPSASKRKI